MNILNILGVRDACLELTGEMRGRESMKVRHDPGSETWNIMMWEKEKRAW